MKVKIYALLPFLTLAAFSLKAFAKPTATITSATIAAANINQGTTYNVVYAAKMKVTVDPVTINKITFTLSGSHDNGDLTYVYIYFNASAPVMSGASYLGYAAANYSGPHGYSININKAMTVNDEGYFIIATSLTNNATDNHTIQVNGATNPVTFGYSVATTVVNNQANKAGAQTIQAADITLTSANIAAANINQGSTYQVVYAAKMKVVTEPVTVNNIKFKLLGNHDNSDLTYVYVYYNASAPVYSGASYLGYAAANYAAPHEYSININKGMAVGDQGYFIILVSLTNNASDNKTIFMNGDTEPVEFGFITNPNITDNQANKSKKLTIQAADITLTTPNISAGNIAQGSTYNVVYAAKMKVTTMPVTVNNIQFTLSGNHDNNDLTYVYLYYNASAPVMSGATYLGYSAATYAAPHDYSINVNKGMAVGDEGYFIVAVSVNATATIGKTVRINGATDPMEFGFTTDPNITNNQSNNTGTKTIVHSFAPFADEPGNNISSDYAVNGLFPNPATSSFTFSVSGKRKEMIKAQLTGRTGNMLLEKTLSMSEGINRYSMNVSKIPNGVYYLVVSNDAGIKVARQQVIVQH
ncbi:MAG TPA: T9SS type A sorting domain-containing protein [Parafilimonas sp.]|nr:T9SS type A sorting domain-containing protein [Parafilimonas sp.]